MNPKRITLAKPDVRWISAAHPPELTGKMVDALRLSTLRRSVHSSMVMGVIHPYGKSNNVR